jgi:Holliday junction DNA helicase RuvA
MIGYLTGVFRAPNLVLTGSGVGYQVTVGDTVDDGAQVELWVHTTVRENDLSLFGFRDRQALELFRAVVAVPRVGPQTAVGLLRSLGWATVGRALVAGDAAALARAPGVGPKLAQTLCAAVVVPAAVSASLDDTDDTAVSDHDLVGALVSQGVPEAVARARVAEARAALGADAGDAEILLAAFSAVAA